jgi:hypothetical protein
MILLGAAWNNKKIRNALQHAGFKILWNFVKRYFGGLEGIEPPTQGFSVRLNL